MENIYISDLDHTLLRSDHTISDFTKDIWHKVAQNSLISIATARSYQSVITFLKDIEFKTPLIVLDGSMIISPNDKIITTNSLSNDTTQSIIEVGLKFGISPFIIGLKDSNQKEVFLYPKVMNANQQFVFNGYRDDPRTEYNPKNKSTKTTMKLSYFGELEVLEPFANELKRVFKESLEIKLSPENYTSGYFLTVLNPKSDKSNALKYLLDYLELSNPYLSVFGDSLNDIGMFKLSNKSIAVSNALDEVKSVADIVLPYSNDEDGVAKYLSQLKYD